MTLEEALEISSHSFNNNWTNDELKSEDTFRAMCVGNRDVPYLLTQGKIYDITMAGRIGDCPTLCYVIGDDGNTCHCHVNRFVKMPTINLEGVGLTEHIRGVKHNNVRPLHDANDKE